MESLYWVLAWACHRRCRHCYEDRFRPYAPTALEAVVAEAEANFPRIVPNLPRRLDRIVLSGGEVLLDALRERVTYPAIAALRSRYPAAKVIVQTTGDLLTSRIVGELLEQGAWMISVSGVDDFHVGHEGPERQAALRERLSRMFDAAGMRRSGYAAPRRSWQQEEGPVYGFFGATPDMWIGKLWPRGRAWGNGLSTATIADNFCAQWSGGAGFLNDGEGAEVSVEPDGLVYPCCVKTGAALGSLLEERLDDILASLRGHPAFEAINAGAPDRMGETFGWTSDEFRARSTTRTPDGAAYANLCIGCDRFHAEVLGPVLADLRRRRLAAREFSIPC
jgi:hypothetical protein